MQDADPRRFRTYGLRNLAKTICGMVRQYGAENCSINATGGYKAQIAIAVLMGQAIGVPVFYKHERFDEIILFPPMPIALDYDVWMRVSGMLFDLERCHEPVLSEHYHDAWNERYESLVERVDIDGVEYLELSPAGQIFHETFRSRFADQRSSLLPPEVPAKKKKPPRLESAGWPGEHPEVGALMQKATDEVSQVSWCWTHYFNPDLPQRTRFRLSSKGIEGILSNGKYTAKFVVETSARSDSERAAMVAHLNEWLAEHRG